MTSMEYRFNDDIRGSGRVRPKYVPLSFPQERLFFLDRLSSNNTDYNQSRVLRIRGSLNTRALKTAINLLVERHESLRTYFGEENGTPFQIIARLLTINVKEDDLSNVEKTSQAEQVSVRLNQLRLEPFALDTPPLIRIKILKLSSDEHLLAITTHLIVADGWSQAVLERELLLLYEAIIKGKQNPLTPPELQYADFALWQRKSLSDGILKTGLQYWKRRLAGVGLLDLPADGPRTDDGKQSVTHELKLSPELSSQIHKLGRQEKATGFMVLLAALQALLARWSGQTDIPVGIVVANRPRSELTGVIGFFVNTVVLRSDVGGDLIFRAFLRHVRDLCLDAYANQEVPFEKVVQEINPHRAVGRNALFNVLLNLRKFPIATVDSNSLNVEAVHSGTEILSTFDLKIDVAMSDQISLTVTHDKTLFESKTVKEFAIQYELVLSQMVDNPDLPLLRYSLLTQEGRASIPNPKAHLEVVQERTFLNSFSQVASLNPGHLALVQAERAWTYGELDTVSGQIAETLRSEGLGDEVLTLYGKSDAALVICALGVWKAGGAVLILDAQKASSLVQEPTFVRGTCVVNTIETLKSSEVKNIDRLYRRRLNFYIDEGLTISGRTVSKAETSQDKYGRQDSATLLHHHKKNSALTHSAISGFVHWFNKRFRLTTDDRVAVFSESDHYSALGGICLPLSCGATLFLPSTEDGENLGRWLAENQIAVAQMTPRFGQRLLACQGYPAKMLRHLCFVGEPVPFNQVTEVRRAAPNASVINLYGTAETPPAVSYWTDDRMSNEARPFYDAPLGQGIDGNQLLIFNNEHVLCGIGEVGEIYIRRAEYSESHHRGDNRRGEKSSFVVESRDLVYSSGDIGRYRTDGNVEFLGRRDQQVVRDGKRIDLYRMKAELARQPGVREVSVASRSNGEGKQILVAYVVPRDNQKPESEVLRRKVIETFPGLTMPIVVVLAKSLGRKTDGPVDFDEVLIPAPNIQEEVRRPQTLEEETLCALFKEALGVERIGRDDNFFELGGHSLLAMWLVNRIRAELGLELSVKQIFEAPTVGELSRKLRASREQ